MRPACPKSISFLIKQYPDAVNIFGFLQVAVSAARPIPPLPLGAAPYLGPGRFSEGGRWPATGHGGAVLQTR